MRCGLFCLKSGNSVPLKKIDVTVTIGATVGHVESVSLYENEAQETIEAIFTFPLDDQSAVFKFQAEIEGRTIIAECQEKQQARETYDDAIQSGQTAFLLEEHDQTSDVFKCRLGNLPPGGKAKLTMAYVSELPHEVDGRIRFTLPNVLNPRYGTESQSLPGFYQSTDKQIERVCMNSGQYEMSFMADIQSQSKIQTVVSEFHSIDVTYTLENRRAKVTLKEEFKPAHDFTLLIQYENINQPQAITERGSSSSSGLMKLDVLMLSFYPDIVDMKANTTNLGEYIFVIDRSGSMSGSKMESAKDTLLLFLKSLPVGCYFNIISFGNYYHMLFDTGLPGSLTAGISREYNQENLKKALELQQSMQADMGGTEILTPLQEVYSKPTIPGHPRQLILITDGEVWNTQNIIQLIGSNAGNTRVFSVGIGEGASTALVKGIARAGKGKYEMVKGTERLQQKVMSILKCAMQPKVTNLKVSWELPEGVQAITIPEDTPNVFSGERLILYALIQGAEDKDEIKGIVNLEGQIENKSFRHCLEFDVVGHPPAAETSAPIHRLAAKAQIKELEDKELVEVMNQNEDDGDSFQTQKSNHKQNIILVSTAANIVSKYTSFVGVDKESKVPMKFEKREIPTAIFGSRGPTTALFSSAQSSGFGMFGSAPMGFGGGGALFGSAPTAVGGGSALFGSAPMGLSGGGAVFGSAPAAQFGGGGGFSFGATPTAFGGSGMGGMFGSKPISQPQQQASGFPFSMNTRTGFAASAPIAPGDAASGFGFGSPPQPLQQQQPQQGGCFSFDSSQPQQTSGFSFGSSQTFGISGSSTQGSRIPKVPKGMMGLVYLQTFEGSWDLTDDFASVISVSIDDLMSCTNTLNSAVWATCVALAWLEKYYSAQKQEWEMIEQKAVTWLKQQNNDGVELNSIIMAAQSCIQQKCSLTP